MLIFRYIAATTEGKTIRGHIEADSEKSARGILRDRGLFPIEINKHKERGALFRKERLSQAELAMLTRQLATLLEVGLPIDEALNTVSEQQKNNNSMQHVITGLRTKILEGHSFEYALKQYPHIFSSLYITSIAAGEKTGHLNEVLQKLAEYTETQQKNKSVIKQAMIYPIIMLTITCGIVLFLLTYVVPKIIEVFTNTHQTLPLATRYLIKISMFVQQYGIISLLMILISLLLGSLILNKRPEIKNNWHQLLLRIPGLKKIVLSTNIARYMHTFAILFSAGINIIDTMQLAAKSISNLALQQKLQRAAILVEKGESITQALQNSGCFSPMDLYLIHTGEKSGKISDMMLHAAQGLDQQNKQAVDTALSLMEPLIILIMGAIVLFIVLAILVPVFSMEQMVG